MNRRHLFIALAVIVSVAAFIPAKIAASWRPVRVGTLLGVGTGPPTLCVAERAIVACRYFDACTRFDLVAGTHRNFKRQTIARGGSWTAQLRINKVRKLELVLIDDKARAHAYSIAGFTVSTFEASYEARVLDRQTLRVLPDLNRVELILESGYYRWNFTSRELERSIGLEELSQNFKSGFREEKIAAITRDGTRVVTLDSKGIEWRSTLSSHVTQRFTFTNYRPSNQTSEQIQVSNYGALALYNVYIGGGNSAQWEVRNTSNGRVLWKITLASSTNRAVFSDDEKWLALPINDLKWHICDAQTGALVRTLPRVPNVDGAAFSPDGNTLYSVANGVLYKQRAR